MRTLGLFAALLLAGFLFAQDDTPTLPDGPTKALVERTCTRCHGVEDFGRERGTKAHWEHVIEDMVSRGASATDAEFQQILNYLVEHFGPVKTNVNKATAEDVAKGLEISTSQAEAIVQYRGKNGAFKTIDDLKKVPGVDAKTLEEKKELIEF